jgi:hypothetical protein
MEVDIIIVADIDIEPQSRIRFILCFEGLAVGVDDVINNVIFDC